MKTVPLKIAHYQDAPDEVKARLIEKVDRDLSDIGIHLDREVIDEILLLINPSLDKKGNLHTGMRYVKIMIARLVRNRIIQSIK